MSEELLPVKCKMSIQSDRTVTYFNVPKSVLVRAQEMRPKSEEEIEAFFNEFENDSEIGYLVSAILYDPWYCLGDNKTDYIGKLNKTGYIKVDGEEQTFWVGTKPAKKMKIPELINFLETTITTVKSVEGESQFNNGLLEMAELILTKIK